ncbi:MAG: 2-keto-3-deoxy-L-fuconate dehydrogenase, partial [Loktanella salsilacus]
MKGKTALITAAGAGIGRASAQALAARGVQVIATDLDGSLVAELADTSPNIIGMQLDVLDAAAVEALVASVAPVDILLNCAGWVHDGTILDCDDAVWDRAFNLNAKAMYRITKAVLPGMLDKGA